MQHKIIMMIMDNDLAMGLIIITAFIMHVPRSVYMHIAKGLYGFSIFFYSVLKIFAFQNF